MKKWTWMLLVGVGVLAMGATQALAQAPEETETTQTEFCGICNAKTNMNDLLGEWLTFGLDQRIRATYTANDRTLSKSTPANERNFQRYRTRAWLNIKPTEDITIGARLIWEWFNFCKPDEVDATPRSDAPLDELYVKWVNIADLGVSVTAGRQGMRLGDGWLVYEGTPLDGSRTTYFDAIRTTFDLADFDTTIDAIYVYNSAFNNQWLSSFNAKYADTFRTISETDESGVILYATNKSNENMTMEGYFIYVHRETPRDDNTEADLYNFGGAIDGQWSDAWTYRAETVLQFGKKELNDGRNSKICPQVGLIGKVNYALQDSLSTNAHVGYEYRSGDKNPEESFDILWGRYPQFSNLLQGGADRLEGGPGALTNFHRFNVGVDFKPWEKSIVLLDWNILFADNNNGDRYGDDPDDDLPNASDFGKGCLRGNLLSAVWKITHNKHLASTIVGEMFMPGDYYSNDRNDVATFARYELMVTW